MKFISRQAGEKILIDGHITVTVKSIESDRIVLSIESPRHQPPYREETILLNSDRSSISATSH